MSATTELDLLLKRAITLLHSSEANSAQELRLMLDEEIQKRFGIEKTISNTLTKKQLEAEMNFPGRAVTPPPPKPTETEIINLTNSPAKTISDSPDTIMDSDDGVSGQVTDTGLIVGTEVSETATITEDETNLKEFGDLNCCVCAEMMFTATNRLIECFKCGALYHQDCHKPQITDDEIADEQAHNWQCNNCLNKPSTSKAAGIIVIPDEPPVVPLVSTNIPITPIRKSKSSATSSRSSSSNSSSSIYKNEQVSTKNSPGNTASKSSDDKYASSSKASQQQHNTATGTTPHSSSTYKRSSHSHSSSSNKSKSSSSRHHDNKKNLLNNK